MNNSLLYHDSQKNRLNWLIGADTAYSFHSPVTYKEERVYQVKICDKVISVFNGIAWEITTDEDLICEVLTRLDKIFKAQKLGAKVGELPLNIAV